MRATRWEFTNRAWLFGMIFAVSFPLYALDRTNFAAALANWLAARLAWDADLVARAVFVLAAMLLFLAAALRTWGSAYLNAGVVYAAEVKTASLVADGPYRRVRNPLYFANIGMALGLGAMMSRWGCAVAVVLMVLFCYRLILREEAELFSTQGERYRAYLARVPRLWPSLTARVEASGRKARWADGWKAELWYWGFGVGVAAFAATLNLTVFYVTLGATLGLFTISSFFLRR